MTRDAVIPVIFNPDRETKPEIEGTAFLVWFENRTFLVNMSGSPVFRISGAAKRCDLVGMSTYGRRASGVAWFIDAAILRWARKDICGQA